MAKDEGTCLRGCCWTPHQVCAKKYQCAHHVSSQRATEYREMAANAARELTLTERKPWKR